MWIINNTIDTWLTLLESPIERKYGAHTLHTALTNRDRERQRTKIWLGQNKSRDIDMSDGAGTHGWSVQRMIEWTLFTLWFEIFCIRRENVLVREPPTRRKLVKFFYLKFLNDLIIWIRRELNVSPRASSWRTIRYFDVFRGEREAVPYIKVDNGQVGDWKGCCWYISFHLLALVHQIRCDFFIQFKIN